jgi:hypothetical protein
VNVELIGRREIVERGIPLRARVGLVGEQKFAAASWHSQRLRPRIELRRADGADDPPHRKLVIVERLLVLRIVPELNQGRFRCGHVSAKCRERLSVIGSERLNDLRLHLCQRPGSAGDREKTRALFTDLRIGRAPRDGTRHD